MVLFNESNGGIASQGTQQLGGMDKDAIVVDDGGANNASSSRTGKAAGELTEIESATLGLLADGWKRWEVALALNLNTRTIRAVHSSLLDKLGARTEPHAIANGFRSGLIQLDRRETTTTPTAGSDTRTDLAAHVFDDPPSRHRELRTPLRGITAPTSSGTHS